LRFDFDAICLDSSSSYLQTFIGHSIIAAAGRFLDFVVLCVLLMIPIASSLSSSHLQTFIGHAIIAAASRFLDFVVVCVMPMIPLASIQARLTFKLLLAMQLLLQRVGFSILLLFAFCL
jgi:hypothetical protein